MTKETVSLKEKIVDIVSKAADGIDKKSLADSTVKGIQLEGALSKLLKEKILKVEVKEGQKFYFVNPEIPETKIPEEKNTAEVNATATSQGKKSASKGKKEKPEAKTKDDDEVTEKSPDKKGQSDSKRDMKKYRFDNQQYGKSNLVLAVVKKYVEKHKNITAAKLKEVFPDELLQRFGVFQTVVKAKQFTSGGRERFFLKPEQVVKISGGPIAISNQWTSESIQPFLKIARKLFEIK